MRRPPWLCFGCLAAVCGCRDRDDVKLQAEADNTASAAAAGRKGGVGWDQETPRGKSGLPGEASSAPELPPWLFMFSTDSQAVYLNLKTCFHPQAE